MFSSIVTSAQLVAFTHARVCPDNKFRHKVDTSFDKGRIRGQIKGKDSARVVLRSEWQKRLPTTVFSTVTK